MASETAVAPQSSAWKRREVPKDHSCLFSSLVYLVKGADVFNKTMDRYVAVGALRKFCADTVRGQPDDWPEWKLGREPSEYADWIIKSTSWGGEIELLILSKHLNVEVCVVDMVTRRISSYNSDSDASKVGRVHILYTGLLHQTTLHSRKFVFMCAVFRGRPTL